MATPHVSGIMALIMSTDSKRSPLEARNVLINSATVGLLEDVQSSPNLLAYSNINNGEPTNVGCLYSISKSFILSLLILVF